ncbi:chord-domain-containing protein [Globomyces pollinis-pini]|nr:chord-domain-containing protein [Globomyces pollinis-pini]
MAICANKGCGKPFVQDEKCSFHPGAPVFHDALKGWSCCEKKVVDFDAFLKIPGCTTGSHSNVAIQAPVKAPVKETKTDVSVSKPETKPIVVQPKDVQSSQLKVEAKAEVKKDQKPKSDESVKVPEKDLFDDPNAVIEIGTKCKRPSCGHAYTDTSKSEKCTFHNGSPIFHEGSKGWSCCSRKVLEFDEFLKIKGCTEGNHRFTAGQTTSGPVFHFFLNKS